MLADLGKIGAPLSSAQENARDGNARDAVEALDKALRMAVAIRAGRDAALDEAANEWRRTWHPRGVSVNGRRVLHEFDDIEDARRFPFDWSAAGRLP
jgi:hypothetical protein